MQGTIIQLLSLVAHGNAYLAGELATDYFPGNSAFRFCKCVRFKDMQRVGDKMHERDFADDPLEWFGKLRKTGVHRFRARYASSRHPQISDRMSVGFVGGGGRWLIEAVKPHGSELWEARWEVGDRNDPDQNIWHVKYGRILRSYNEPMPAMPDVSVMHEQLRDILDKISTFARGQGSGNFADCFDLGIQALSGSDPDDALAYSVLPEAYADPAYHQLMRACQRAWVFGGMGSWNDMGFPDEGVQKEYEALSDTLFNTMLLALQVAVNAPHRFVAKARSRRKKWWRIWERD